MTDFVGVREHGNNWKILETTIPTRNGTQIRSHAQKFFTRIKNELGVTDPLKYIQENSCDELILYKFDDFHVQDGDTNKEASDEISGNPLNL